MPRRGLEEFFDRNPTGEQSGRRWTAADLRRKSNQELHKLWYVLLKERNMLATMSHESRRLGVPLVDGNRVWKVRKGMGAIKTVVGERDRQIRQLHDEEAEALFKSEAIDEWHTARQVEVHNVHQDVEDDEFEAFIADVLPDVATVRIELLLPRHLKRGSALIEVANDGDAKKVYDALHNSTYIDYKLKVQLDPDVATVGVLSERPLPNDGILKNRMLYYKQFPKAADPLRLRPLRRLDEITERFEDLQAQERAHAATHTRTDPSADVASESGSRPTTE